ncbi:MAG: hypothetical protein R2784_14810 [Saprospiraceae bacterium]
MKSTRRKELLERMKEEEKNQLTDCTLTDKCHFSGIFQSEIYDEKELFEDEISILVNLTQLITELLKRVAFIPIWDPDQAGCTKQTQSRDTKDTIVERAHPATGYEHQNNLNRTMSWPNQRTMPFYTLRTR